MIRKKYEAIKNISHTQRRLYKKYKAYQQEIDTGNENARIEFEGLDIWYFANRLFYYLYKEATIYPRTSSENLKIPVITELLVQNKVMLAKSKITNCSFGKIMGEVN